MSSKARWITVAGAAATVACLTASAVAAPSPSPAKAEAVVAAEAKGKPHKPGKPTENRARIAEALAKGVAARLGVSLASAQEAVKELFVLADRPGGVDPHSAQFAAIASKLGVSAGQFEKALAQTKQSLGKQVVDDKHKGKGKPGDGKVVIKHQGSDDDAGVELFAKGVAARLGVGTGAVQQAVRELFALADRPGGVDPHGTQFAAIAKKLGVTAEQFEEALSGAKQELAAKDQSKKG
jgi:hypothetical protein